MKINFKFYVICFFLLPSKIIGQHLSLDDLIKFQKQTVVETNNTLLPKGWFFAGSIVETDTTYGVSRWNYTGQYSSNLVTGSLNYKFARNVSNRVEYLSSNKTTFSEIQEKIKSFGMILFNSFTGDNYIISDYRGKNYILRITFYSEKNHTIYKYQLFERSDFENDYTIENKFVDKSIYTGKYLICTSILNAEQNYLMEEASSFSYYFYRIPLNSKVYILEDSDDIFDKHYKVYVDGYIGFVHSGYLKDEPLKKEISELKAEKFKGNVKSAELGGVVSIGSQVWTSKNLDVSTYRNGDVIPQVQDAKAWANLTTGAWCYYDNDSSNGKKYGKLYNWYAVNDPRGLAPKGYHIPSDAEWTQLSDYLGGIDSAGTKMKSTSGWYSNGNSTNSSGFSGLPGGSRQYDGAFYFLDFEGYWWSSTEWSTFSARYRCLFHHHGFLVKNGNSKEHGFSVRCIWN
jgi:uncharacterized protein (TIGR02145 family)